MTTNKRLIIAVIGRSGSGKNYFVEAVKKEVQVNVIKSYTTRKPRSKNNKEYYFITDKELKSVPKEELCVSTVFGNDTYFIKEEQLYQAPISLFIVDIVGYRKLLKMAKLDNELEILAVYLDIDVEQCRENMLRRKDDMEQVMGRLIHDASIYKSLPPYGLRSKFQLTFTNTKKAAEFIISCLKNYISKYSIELNHYL